MPHPDSNDDLPDKDGPYDEYQRKPPDSYRDWWYHSDHLGSSTYLTDNFGRPSHYYETLPFGEMIVEHNQSSFYDNKYKFNGKELDDATQMYYYGARYYDPRLSIFISVDPLAEKYPNYTPYNYTLNNPINLIDPDGREPIKPYVGTVGNFVSLLNNSPSKVGAYTGTKAHNYMLSLGNTKWNWKQMRPLPTQTGYFNMKKGRYIYTTKGGWVDMTHFMFYAGKAYKYKEDGISNPIGNAVQDGYAQEASDVFVAGHSAYSYEDLPSDYYGADFAVNHFDPNSKETFAEQLGNYLINELGATNPEDAPNYENLTTSDNRKTPTRQNKTTRPLYIEGDKGNKVIDKEQLPGGKKIGEL